MGVLDATPGHCERALSWCNPARPSNLTDPLASTFAERVTAAEALGLHTSDIDAAPSSSPRR